MQYTLYFGSFVKKLYGLYQRTGEHVLYVVNGLYDMCYINLTISECGGHIPHVCAKITTKHMCCSSAQMRVANMSVFPCNQTIRNLGGYQLMQPRHPNQSPNVPNRDIQTNHQMCPTETSKPITKCALQPVCNVLRPAKPAPGMLKLGPDNQRRPYMCWPTIL
jgi:hypothetical protein